MAKYSGTLGYKGLIEIVDGDVIVIEERKVGKGQDAVTIEEPHNFSKKLREEYDGRRVTITVKEDTELEPDDSVDE